MKKHLIAWVVILVLCVSGSAFAEGPIFGSGSGGMATTDIDTSAELSTILTDETGTGAAVFAGSPALTGTPTIGTTAAGGNLTVNATLGSELAPALTGATGVNWTFAGTYTTPLAGTIEKAGDGTDTITPTAATTIVAGTTYLVTITTSAFTAESFAWTLGGVAGITLTDTTTENITQYITAATTGKLIITPTNASRFVISAISIKALTDATGDVTVTGNLKAQSPITSPVSIVNADTTAATDLLINPAVKGSGYLINAQVGGASKFSIDYAGAVAQTGNTIFNSALTISPSTYSISGGIASSPLIYSALGKGLSILGVNTTTATHDVCLGHWDDAYGTKSNTSGFGGFVRIIGGYNQTSGTASNTDLLINRTETAVGSGAQLLIDAQVGSASKFSVSNTGAVATAGSATIGTTAAGGNLTVNATLGSELAPALTGASDVNWTFAGTYTTPLAGTIEKAGAGTDTITPTAATTIVANTVYKVVITTSAFTAGSFYYTIGGTRGATISTATTTTEYIPAGTTGKLIITPTDASRFVISAISISAQTDATGDVTVAGDLRPTRIQMGQATNSAYPVDIYGPSRFPVRIRTENGGGIVIGDYGNTSTIDTCIYPASVTPSTTNFALYIAPTAVSVNGSDEVQICKGGTLYQRFVGANSFFGGSTTPTAKVHLAAGTATASTAPIKLTTGTLLTNPEAGAIEFLTDAFYATTTTGPTRYEIALQGKDYGEVYVYDDATAFNIATADIYHLYNDANVTSGELNGITHSAGLAAATTAFADYSGTVAGTVKATTSAAHGLVTGNVVSISGSTSYNGVFVITKVDDDEFYFTDTWVADDGAAVVNKGSQLVIAVAGMYRVTWALSGTSAVAAKDYKFELFKGVTEIDKSARKDRFSSTDTETVSGTCLLSCAAGDIISFAIKGLTDTTDLTIVNLNINLNRI